MRFFLIGIFVLTNFFVQSQTRIDTIFSNLKSGGILVRLKTNENTLKALKGKNDELADKIIKKRNKRNQEIVDAFKNFTYCPVYFFYSSESVKIKNREFDGVLFDSNLNQVIEEPMLHENYIIADYSYTQKDTVKYYLGDVLVRGEKGLERHEVYGNPYFSTGINALILLSPEFIPLQNVNDKLQFDPSKTDFENFMAQKYIRRYPYYIRTFENFLFLEKSKSLVIDELQFNLEQIEKEYSPWDIFKKK